MPSKKDNATLKSLIKKYNVHFTRPGFSATGEGRLEKILEDVNKISRANVDNYEWSLDYATRRHHDHLDLASRAVNVSTLAIRLLNGEVKESGWRLTLEEMIMNREGHCDCLFVKDCLIAPLPILTPTALNTVR